MCHNLKPLKIDDEDPPSIFKTKRNQIFSSAMCYYVTFAFMHVHIHVKSMLEVGN
jgi:hypothetical protein